MKKGYWFLISIVVLIVDQISKYWVANHLIPYQPVALIPYLNMTLAHNTGAAFSFLSGAGDWHRIFFSFFSSVVCIILIVWLIRADEQTKLQATGISLVLGGALGNLCDRGLHGHVIDFIDVYYEHHHFATFNVADSAICIGAGLLILDLFFNTTSNKI